MTVETAPYQAPVAVFKFVRAERNQGVSFKKVKEGKEYDFGKIRVSDEHESFDVDCTPQLADYMNQDDDLKKGDFVELFYEVGQSFGNTSYTVVGYNKVN